MAMKHMGGRSSKTIVPEDEYEEIGCGRLARYYTIEGTIGSKETYGRLILFVVKRAIAIATIWDIEAMDFANLAARLSLSGDTKEVRDLAKKVLRYQEAFDLRVGRYPSLQELVSSTEYSLESDQSRQEKLAQHLKELLACLKGFRGSLDLKPEVVAWNNVHTR